MTQQRYGTELHTPGDNRPGPADIVRHDPEVLAEWNEIHTRRQELKDNLAEVNGELAEIIANLGELVAAGGDYKVSTDRLGDLRSERAALKAALEYLAGRAEILRRNNYWLVTL
jgi:predicted nuclease with TOPRIM domain